MPEIANAAFCDHAKKSANRVVEIRPIYFDPLLVHVLIQIRPIGLIKDYVCHYGRPYSYRPIIQYSATHA